MILGYILAFTFSISGAYFASRKLKTSIAKVLPFYLMTSALVSYVFAMVGQLQLGYILIILASIIPTAIHLFLKRKNLAYELKPFRTPSFAIICIVYLLLGAINFGRTFHAWDDFMHWGPFVKETYRNLALYNTEASLVEVHADYPPIVTLYETFWVYLSGKYNESILFIALHFLQISFFFPFIDKLKWPSKKGDKAKFVGLAIALVLAPAIISLGDDYFFVTIMTDSLVGMLFAFALANIMLADRIDKKLFSKLAVIFAFLILVKQISIAFIAIAIAALIIKIVCSDKKKKFSLIALALSTVVFALILNYTWNQRVESLNIQGQFQISSLLTGLKELIIHKGDNLLAWQKETAINFAKAYLYDKPIILSLSYFKLTIVFALAAIYISIKCKNRRKEALLQSALIALSSVAYAFTMMLLYMFCFGEVEGPILASFDRYLATFWLAIAMLAFSNLLIKIQKQDLIKQPNLGVIALVAYILITSPASIALTILRTYDKNNYIADTTLLEREIEQDKKVFIVSQDSNGSHNIKLKYLLNPIQTNPSFGYGYNFGPENDNDLWSYYVAEKDFKKYVEGYDYIYLYNVNDYFVRSYSKWFDQELKSGNLYKINENGFTYISSR